MNNILDLEIRKGEMLTYIYTETTSSKLMLGMRVFV